MASDPPNNGYLIPDVGKILLDSGAFKNAVWWREFFIWTFQPCGSSSAVGVPWELPSLNRAWASRQDTSSLVTSRSPKSLFDYLIPVTQYSHSWHVHSFSLPTGPTITSRATHPMTWCLEENQQNHLQSTSKTMLLWIQKHDCFHVLSREWLLGIWIDGPRDWFIELYISGRVILSSNHVLGWWNHRGASTTS